MNDDHVPGDPFYEESDREERLDARLVLPKTAQKNRKIVVAGMVLAGTLLGVVMLANIAGLVTGRADGHAAPKPLTMTKQQSDSFAQQQSGQAAYLKGMDHDKNSRKNEDTILGYGKGLASETFEEVDGVPKKTQAQDDAEHGRSPSRARSRKRSYSGREPKLRHYTAARTIWTPHR